MNVERIKSWVVYQIPVGRLPHVVSAVCDQGEWDAIELSRPGHCTLIRAGIGTEGEAEQLARSVTAASSDRVIAVSPRGIEARPRA